MLDRIFFATIEKEGSDCQFWWVIMINWMQFIYNNAQFCNTFAFLDRFIRVLSRFDFQVRNSGYTDKNWAELWKTKTITNKNQKCCTKTNMLKKKKKNQLEHGIEKWLWKSQICNLWCHYWYHSHEIQWSRHMIRSWVKFYGSSVGWLKNTSMST